MIIKLIALLIVSLVLPSFCSAQSYLGFSFSSLHFENGSLKNADLSLKNHSDHVPGMNIRFTRICESENLNLTIQPGYRKHHSYVLHNAPAFNVEEQIVEVPVLLYYLFGNPSERAYFTIGAGFNPAFVVDRDTDISDPPEIESFRLEFASEIALNFNLTEDNDLNAAIGFRGTIDKNAYKSNPVVAPAYMGWGFFLAINCRL